MVFVPSQPRPERIYPPVECWYCLIRIYPGHTLNWYARRFSTHRGIAMSRLTTMEARGLLLAEDNCGRLFALVDVYTTAGVENNAIL